jgi:SAM-dependent methyltransferase
MIRVPDDDNHKQSADEIIDAYYRDHYANIHSAGQLGRASASFHRSLESTRRNESYPVTLELGAGNLEHYSFVHHSFETYIASDIRSFMRSSDVDSDERLQVLELDAENLNLSDRSVDRIIATCLIVHLADPWKALHEWQRVCRPNGVIDFLVPCDPGFASRAFRRWISEPSARRRGVSAQEYRLVNALEHGSSFMRILSIARAAVLPDRQLSVEYHPFRVLRSWNLNGYAIFRISASS